MTDTGTAAGSAFAHGASRISAVTIDTYNAELRDSDGFIRDRASKRVPEIDGEETHVVMQNDAVAQGLSEIPDMTDVTHWGVLTIGTGLGNACFTNRAGDK